MDPLLKAAEGGLLGSIEFGVILYQTRSCFRSVVVPDALSCPRSPLRTSETR